MSPPASFRDLLRMQVTGAALATVLMMSACAAFHTDEFGDLGSMVDVVGAAGIISCDQIRELDPETVGEVLQEAGYQVVWRFHEPTGAGSGTTRDVPGPPQGTTVTDVTAFSGGVAFVFVMERHRAEGDALWKAQCQRKPS